MALISSSDGEILNWFGSQLTLRFILNHHVFPLPSLSSSISLYSKRENLLLDDKDNLKVSYFGLFTLTDRIKQDDLLHTTDGMPAYVAAKVIEKKGYHGAKANLYSCSVILYILLASFLPFQDENIVPLYHKIYKGDFKCPPWFSPESRRIMTKLLDLNPNTRITTAKLMKTLWFKKLLSRSLRTTEEVAAEEGLKGKELENLNAVQIISPSEGFDLLPLFEDIVGI
ncbi:hypothetical protein ACLOJK_009107 [Asimina triloba]